MGGFLSSEVNSERKTWINQKSWQARGGRNAIAGGNKNTIYGDQPVTITRTVAPTLVTGSPGSDVTGAKTIGGMDTITWIVLGVALIAFLYFAKK
jgi:hypothetical protein